MSLLEFFFIISGIVILIIAIDIARKQKFNAIHFLVFIAIGGGLLTFSFFPNTLNAIGEIFGVARGSDVLVYSSIVFLLYFVLLLLTKHVENKETLTSLVRYNALLNAGDKKIKGKEVFLIRAYNEQAVIKGVIDKIIKAGYKNILVVNDGSKDKTLDILKSFGDDIIVVSHPINRGAGAALETGFEYIRRNADVEYIITFDADDQHHVSDLDKFITKLDNDKDLGIIFGSRFIEKTNTNVPLIRKITLFLGKLFTAALSGIYLTDAHNGFRVLRLETVNKLKITIDTMAYASELIEEVRINKIKYAEVPVNITYSKYSLSKGQSSGNAISIALRIIWSKFFR